jgi:shikimate kinase
VACDDRHPRVFLVGFMASGKSTVGRLLAARMSWEAVDTDLLVEQRAGCAVEAIFRDWGEGRFRQLEWEALQALGDRSRVVVATGGGAFLGAAERRFMRRCGRTVWLDVPLEECRRRAASGAVRPVWQAADPVAFRAFFDKRRAAYALAEIRLPWEAGQGPEEVAEHLLRYLSGEDCR